MGDEVISASQDGDLPDIPERIKWPPNQIPFILNQIWKVINTEKKKAQLAWL